MRLIHGLVMVATLALASGCNIGNSAGGCTADAPCVCDGIGNCERSCPEGGCEFICSGIGNCILSCEGGGCSMACQGTGNCTLDCPGGDCTADCSGLTGNCICTGCGEEPTPDAGPARDAGADAGAVTSDAGTDAGSVTDGGGDAGEVASDAGDAATFTDAGEDAGSAPPAP
jgi:hypothetical protein